MLETFTEQQKTLSTRVRQKKSEPLDTKEVSNRALKLTVPYWPLQNTVAVNPFWDLRQNEFHSVVENLFSVTHSPLYMPLDYFLDLFERGRVTQAQLEKVLNDARKADPLLPSNVADFLGQSRQNSFHGKKVFSLAEFADKELGGNWHLQTSNDCSKHAASYFDSNQALAKNPWRKRGFLDAWLMIQSYDRTMKINGVVNFQEFAKQFAGKSADEVIDDVLIMLGIRNANVAVAYLRRLIACNFGWFSQFRYVEWQKSLGYTISSNASAKDYLAVKLIYEAALAEWLETDRPVLIENWHETLHANAPSEESQVHGFRFQRVWLKAFEKTYQASIVHSLKKTPEPRERPKYQLAFCIDVRSEMIRRNLEKVSAHVQTVGFAGFFGIAAEFKPNDEREPGQRCPVLLTPGLQVEDAGYGEQARNQRLGRTLARGYFKNLRKGFVSSFLYVEVFGFFSLFALLGNALRGKKSRGIPARFNPKLTQPKGQFGTVDESVERAATVLQHMGLTSDFAPMVIIVGHGSQTTNNAFGSALDCGACGGHAGDINARVLAQLLNDPEVRTGLANSKSINIPPETWFTAAIHETVTDTIYLLSEKSTPLTHGAMARELQAVFNQSSVATQRERTHAVSIRSTDPAERRSANWAEVRPEWGLSNNACFIVAPRSRTLGANLSSRSFLHDYDWKKDTQFKTLELIMTAPMVVTNWINLQYYASTVAPNIYGSGNKVLHNLINENGVVEGNGGDLRVGLPMQSVHDGTRPVHEPMRLNVFIEAPRSAIESIIEKHATVSQLVDNGWLNLLHIQPESSAVFSREAEGKYTLVGEAAL